MGPQQGRTRAGGWQERLGAGLLHGTVQTHAQRAMLYRRLSMRLEGWQALAILDASHSHPSASPGRPTQARAGVKCDTPHLPLYAHFMSCRTSAGQTGLCWASGKQARCFPAACAASSRDKNR